MNQRSTLEQRACHGLTFTRAPHTVLLVVLSSQRRRGRSVTVANVPAAIRRGELRVRRVASIPLGMRVALGRGVYHYGECG
jgi:hypothetical protein